MPDLQKVFDDLNTRVAAEIGHDVDPDPRSGSAAMIIANVTLRLVLDLVRPDVRAGAIAELERRADELESQNALEAARLRDAIKSAG
jgi:hypothetical protein